MKLEVFLMKKILLATTLFALTISSCGSGGKVKTKGWTEEQKIVYGAKIDFKKVVSVVLDYDYTVSFDMNKWEEADPNKGETFNRKYTVTLDPKDYVYDDSELEFYLDYGNNKKEQRIYPVPDIKNDFGYGKNNLILKKTYDSSDPLDLKVRKTCYQPELILLAYNYHCEVFLSGYTGSGGGGGGGTYEEGDIIEIPPTGFPGPENGTPPTGEIPEPEPDSSNQMTSSHTATSSNTGSDERGPAELQPKKGIHRFIQNTSWDFDKMQTSYTVGTPFSANGVKAIAHCMDYSEDYSYIDYVNLDVTAYVRYECIEVEGDGIETPLEYVVYDEPPCDEAVSRRLRFWVDCVIDGWHYEKSPHYGLTNEVTIDFIYIYYNE